MYGKVHKALLQLNNYYLIETAEFIENETLF
jgi:hypothetical protein